MNFTWHMMLNRTLLGLVLMGMVGCGGAENSLDGVKLDGSALNSEISSASSSESQLAGISSEIRRDENGNITFVDLRTFRPLTDAILVRLTGLNELKELTMAGMKVTDAGLIHLKGLTNLEAIWLTRTKVTDAGLVHIKGLDQLDSLAVPSTQITDAGVAELQKAFPDLLIIK